MYPETPGGNRIVEIGGGAFETGRALGRLHARAVAERLVGEPAWREVIQRGRADERVPAMLAQVEERFPDILLELKGLADGLGQDFADVFAWNCRGDLWAMAPDGCTTVRFPGETAHVVGHNEDGMPVLAGHCALVRVSPTQGRSFTAFTYPGSLPGHTFGMNAAGLVSTVNNIRSLQAQAGVPRMVLTRAVLGAATLDEALNLIRTSPRAGAFHLTLAQRGDPRLMAVEFTGTRVSVEQITAPSAHANHLVHADMTDVAQIVTDSSLHRQRRADRLLAADNASLGDALRILFDRGDAALPIHRSAPDDPDHENTLATAVFSIQADRVEWAVYDGDAAAARAAA